jgi:methyl-accepting chemotaxis protein
VKDADGVRKIAKQTSRAVAEQAEVIASVTNSAARQTTSMQAVARSTAEQVTATEQIAQAMRSLRGQTKDIASALVAQAKEAGMTAADVALLSRELAAIRGTNGEQAKLVAAMTVGDEDRQEDPRT